MTVTHFSKSVKHELRVPKTTQIMIDENISLKRGLVACRSSSGSQLAAKPKCSKAMQDLFSTCSNTRSFTNIKLQLELSKNNENKIKSKPPKPPLILHRKSTPGFKLKSIKESKRKITTCLKGIRRKGRNIELQVPSRRLISTNLSQVPKYFSLKSNIDYF